LKHQALRLCRFRKSRNQTKPLLGIETRVRVLLSPVSGLRRNQTKPLLGIETHIGSIRADLSHRRNQTKPLLGIETIKITRAGDF